MPKIFVVEDDVALREQLCLMLDLQGFTCVTSDDFPCIEKHILAAAPDCVVLDLKLPGTNGHSICRNLRAASAVPIIMLTSSDSEFDELMSMNLGADDYVSKPYNPAILVARIASVLRRAQPQATPTITHGALALDVAAGTVARADDPETSIELTRNEFKILHLLMSHPGTIMARAEIMCELWLSDAFIDDNTLTVNINRLRQKLAGIGVQNYLITRRGQGYRV
ncbi:MAG: response regulator transcription factor [Raoultibacter sp.]